MRDCSKMLQKLDVLSAMHLIAEPWRLTTPTTKKNCFMKHGSLSDHVSSNDHSAVKLSENEEDGWHSPHVCVQSEDYPTCDSTLEVCGVWNVNQVLDQHLIRPEEPEEKVAQHKATERTENTWKVLVSI
jgi:hypothetical protein